MILEAIKQNGWVIRYVESMNYEMCFIAISNMTKSFSNIKYDSENLKVENIKFFISGLELEYYIDNYDGYSDMYLKEINEKYSNTKILVITLEIFNKLKNYLLNFNKGNCFIFDKSINLEIIKEVAVSDNELMYIKYEDEDQLSNKYKGLINREISVNDLIVEE